MFKFDKATAGKVVLALVGVGCTIGSYVVGDIKQKATVTEEATKAAEKAVAKLLENQVKES